MGTKDNPGAYDCYAKADPDEPMFILLGRDRHAPALVDLWATLRAAEGENGDKVDEARDCAIAMRHFRFHRHAVPSVRCAECDNGIDSPDWTYCPYCGAQGRTEKAA